MNSKAKWFSLLVFVMLVWATVYPATKSIVGEVDPLALAFLRYLLATMVLLPFYLKERRRKRDPLPWRDLRELFLLGILGISGFSLFLTFGIQLSTAANGSVLANSQPIFTTLLAPLIIKERSSPLRLAGAMIGVIGVYLIVTSGKLISLEGGTFWGNVLLVAASLSISIYSILLKRYVKTYGGLIPSFLTMLSGSVFMLLVVLACPARESLSGIRPHDWLMLLYIGIVGTALVYPLFNMALKKVGVIRAVGFKLLIPVFGVSLSMLLIGEEPGITTFLGAFLVIASVYLIQRIPLPLRRPAG